MRSPRPPGADLAPPDPDPARAIRRALTEALRAAAIKAPTCLVAAVSGGPDSVCLGHAAAVWAKACNSRLIIAHFDHRLRPDSASDAEFAAGLARSWDVEFQLGQAPAPPADWAGRSPELWARRQRWGFLESCARSHGAAAVLTAHHLGDQAETLLLRLLRGSGSAGLGAMPVVDDRFEPPRVRPLLGIRRQVISGYLDAEHLPFRSDPTNLEPSTDRNRIRLQVLPLLEQIRPGAPNTIARAAENLRFESELLANLADAARPRAGVRPFAGAFEFEAARFAGIEKALQMLLLRNLCAEISGQVPRRAVLGAAQAFSGGSGPASLRLTPAVVMERSRGHCLLRPKGWNPPAAPPSRKLDLGSEGPIQFRNYRFWLRSEAVPGAAGAQAALHLPPGSETIELAAIPPSNAMLADLPHWRRNVTPGLFVGNRLLWGLGLGIIPEPLPAGSPPIAVTLQWELVN